MAKKQYIDPSRQRLMEAIEDYLVIARDNIQMATDIADLLNEQDTTGEKIKIDGNVVSGIFKKAVK
jgi:hypothetical protein